MIDSQSLHSRREAIDSEIRALKARLAILKSQRNTVALISQLPTEILTHILSLLRLDGRHDSSRLKATHVCRRWREVALACPYLWSEVTSLRRLNGILELIRRAKNVDLTFDIDETFPTTNVILGQLVTHIGRTQTLKLEIDYRNWRWCNSLLMSKPAPALQSLQLVSTTDIEYQLPSDMFMGTCPPLRSLSLRRCFVNFSSPLFHCELTHLTLIDICAFVDEENGFTKNYTTELLNALRELPCLLELHISRPSPPWVVVDSNLASHATIPLPHLKLLYLEAHVNYCSGLVSHFVLPYFTRLKLSSELWETIPPIEATVENAAVAAATQFLRQYIGNLAGDTRVASVCFTDGYQRQAPGATLNISPVDPSSDLFNHNSVSSLPGSLEIYLTGESHSLGQAIFRALGAILPLHEMRSCSLAGYFNHAEADWYPLIQQSKNVTTLVVGGNMVDGFAKALATLSQQDHTVRPYPRLRHLRIENAAFVRGSPESFCSALCAGFDDGRSLALSLRSCSIKEAHIRVLKRHFTSVKWDGSESGERWGRDTDEGNE
ncbi:hypothetical protein HETIRDRAFT_480534 [Heterobasidion irregulare TC 32-1]|uniref:F-box domain-containing protein n=1 Tax=Heterobasidion irregulare (strain TC 32-1) TaxID=747525 RepID=W4JU58_HETIT|nr:uncharacterized protein HETIRDRAFT_480534 [Heterobasidion irregulare TC 32-1]ETW76406.1 hypothetical protein HETIRDRAFT_480534 [Heterobasidion irregulare TC 32-1]